MPRRKKSAKGPVFLVPPKCCMCLRPDNLSTLTLIGEWQHASHTPIIGGTETTIFTNAAALQLKICDDCRRIIKKDYWRRRVVLFLTFLALELALSFLLYNFWEDGGGILAVLIIAGLAVLTAFVLISESFRKSRDRKAGRLRYANVRYKSEGVDAPINGMWLPVFANTQYNDEFYALNGWSDRIEIVSFVSQFEE